MSDWNFPSEEDLAAKSAAEAADAITEAATIAITSELTLTEDSLEAMLESPKRAVKGLTAGIAEGLGVDTELVTITRTVPDLLTFKRQLEESTWRRTSDEVTLVVDFEVQVGKADSPAELTASLDKMAAGDADIADAMSGSIQKGLEAQKIEVEISGMSAKVVTTTPAPPEEKGEDDDSAAAGRLNSLLGAAGVFAALVLQAPAFEL
jgi:hypothetical protein